MIHIPRSRIRWLATLEAVELIQQQFCFPAVWKTSEDSHLDSPGSSKIVKDSSSDNRRLET